MPRAFKITKPKNIVLTSITHFEVLNKHTSLPGFLTNETVFWLSYLQECCILYKSIYIYESTYAAFQTHFELVTNGVVRRKEKTRVNEAKKKKKV